MSTIVIRLDPERLANPDVDIRYALPDLLTKRSDGAIRDDGYDYLGEPPFMLIFLSVDDLERDLAVVLDALKNDIVLDNRLIETAVVAVEDAKGACVVRDVGAFRVVHPPGFAGDLAPSAGD